MNKITSISFEILTLGFNVIGLATFARSGPACQEPPGGSWYHDFWL